MEQYIGANKVEQTIILDHTTPSGEEIVKVVYEGEVEDQLMSLKMFNAVITKEISDATALREAMTTPVAEDVIKVMADWGIRMVDIPYMIQQKVLKSIEDSTDRVHSKLFTSKLEVNSDDNIISLLHYDIVLDEENE